jgi:hypothetical protein
MWQGYGAVIVGLRGSLEEVQEGSGGHGEVRERGVRILALASVVCFRSMSR